MTQLPIKIEYDFVKDLEISEDQLPYVNVSIIVKPSIENEDVIAYRPSRVVDKWTDDWKIYDVNGILVYHGWAIHRLSYFTTSQIKEVDDDDETTVFIKYLREYESGKYWTYLESDLLTRIYWDYYDDVYDCNVYNSSAQIYQNINGVRNKGATSNFSRGQLSKHFFKLSENKYRLQVEGYFYKMTDVEFKGEKEYKVLYSQYANITNYTPIRKIIYQNKANDVNVKLLVNITEPKNYSEVRKYKK